VTLTSATFFAGAAALFAALGAAVDPRYFLAAGILLGTAALLYAYDHQAETAERVQAALTKLMEAEDARRGGVVVWNLHTRAWERSDNITPAPDLAALLACLPEAHRRELEQHWNSKGGTP